MYYIHILTNKIWIHFVYVNLATLQVFTWDCKAKELKNCISREKRMAKYLYPNDYILHEISYLLSKIIQCIYLDVLYRYVYVGANKNRQK